MDTRDIILSRQRTTKVLIRQILLSGRGWGLNFYLIIWLKRGTKNNMASKIVKNNMLDPYDGNDSILFDISKCRWFLGEGGGGGRSKTPFSTYILSETKNYVYIIFRANTIISSATRHHSNISLASTNNI